jgi:hypothetical protein
MSPIVCSDNMKKNTYWDLRNDPATIARKMMTTPMGLALDEAVLPQNPPI